MSRRAVNPVLFQRALSGVFPVLKPSGITSAQTLNQLKAQLNEELSSLVPQQEAWDIKLGHGGTLDSHASGVLGVGVGEGTRMLPCFLHGEKTYVVRGHLGIATNTYNQQGSVTMEKSYDHVTESELQQSLKQFLGRIKQTPPVYSALKRRGKRYSDLAEAGIDFQIEPREVQCYRLELSDFSAPNFTLLVECGSGFYVRSLIHDLGLAVGSCAHARDLQRTHQGPFTLSDCLSEEDWSVDSVVESIKSHRRAVSWYFKKHTYRKINNDKW